MSEIRNVAVLSHSGAGKTSLVEAMLFRSGALPVLGSVEDGNTASDTTAEEKRRKISIYSTVHALSWRGDDFNIIDTPGYADFVSEIRGGLAAADAAMIVVSAVSGVAVGTERVWTNSLERELSTLIVINKMDRENADFFRTMTEIESTLPGNIAAIQVPIGQTDDFKGLVDLLSMTAYEWPEGEPVEIPVPDEVRGLATEYRDRLIEAIVETDDELMLKYLEDEEFDQQELRTAFDAAVRRNELTPVLITSAAKVMGVSLLLDFLKEGVRRVEDHAPLRVDQGEPPQLGSSAPFTARVFKTVIDPYLGKISMLRVLGGSLRQGESFRVANRDQELKAAHLYVPKGAELSEVKELTAGMIGAITKAEGVATGDTLTTPDDDLVLSQIRVPTPVMALALFPKARPDEDKLGEGLQRLLEADSGLKLERNADTHQTVLWGMGHVHLEIAINTLRDRYGVDVDSRVPAVAYRETINGKGEARYRHKKQTGGAGQFAEVALRVEPLPREAGFVFDWAVVGGSIPTQFQSSCEKGVGQALGSGALGGFPVQDVKVIVYDGKDHPVDSKDVAFQVAAGHAFKEAMAQAKPTLLEPVMLVKVRVPDRFTGDVISDLNSRRGRILGMESEGSVSVVSAHVPMSEIQSYSADLRSMTGGRGAYSLKFDRYDGVPQHIADRVIQDRQPERAAG